MQGATGKLRSLIMVTIDTQMLSKFQHRRPATLNISSWFRVGSACLILYERSLSLLVLLIEVIVLITEPVFLLTV
jgi:hypothetical protein